MANKPIDISGKIFGTSVAISATTAREGKGGILWACRCSCDYIFTAVAGDLARGRHQMCPSCREEYARMGPYRTLYGSYKSNAEKRGYSFELDFEDFVALTRKNCTYCCSEPFQIYRKGESRRGITYMGVDRQDNSLGYTQDNVVPCCKFCNLAKSRFPLDEFLAWLSRVNT